jgi:hypothetical protein
VYRGGAPALPCQRRRGAIARGLAHGRGDPLLRPAPPHPAPPLTPAPCPRYYSTWPYLATKLLLDALLLRLGPVLLFTAAFYPLVGLDGGRVRVGRPAARPASTGQPSQHHCRWLPR